ncbi:MAG TPA: hypothetical protein PLX33_07195 [Alphaproteobacteria bacterium]|nr:hypothetical protein [Alphaproteobacteria bacterium]
MSASDTPEKKPEKAFRRFLSTERDHIVQVMEKLALALPPSVLEDAQNPLLVSVKGARCIGKSLIPAVFRETLLGASPQLEGRAEFDERWKGAGTNGRSLEVGFVNIIWPFMDMSDSLKELYPKDKIRPSKQDVADAYLSQREHGGVTFVSYAEQAERLKPGLVIEMLYESLPKHLPDEKRLSQKFFKAMCDNSLSPWLRIVKMEVSDPRLLQSEEFMKTFNSLRAVYKSPPRENPARSAVPAVKPAVWGS